MIELWSKVRVIDPQESIEERASVIVVDVTELVRQTILIIRFESGEKLQVDSSEVEIVSNGL